MHRQCGTSLFRTVIVLFPVRGCSVSAGVFYRRVLCLILAGSPGRMPLSAGRRSRLRDCCRVCRTAGDGAGTAGFARSLVLFGDIVTSYLILLPHDHRFPTQGIPNGCREAELHARRLRAFHYAARRYEARRRAGKAARRGAVSAPGRNDFSDSGRRTAAGLCPPDPVALRRAERGFCAGRSRARRRDSPRREYDAVAIRAPCRIVAFQETLCRHPRDRGRR